MVAVDIDVSGLADLALDASIEVVKADLEAGDWPLGDRAFDAIVVTNYLHRPLLQRLPDALRARGALIYETFAVGHEAHGRPRNRAHLLEEGELLRTFTPRLEVVAYEQVEEREPRPAVRQRICALLAE